jgi:hypothetical protein
MSIGGDWRRGTDINLNEKEQGLRIIPSMIHVQKGMGSREGFGTKGL